MYYMFFGLMKIEGGGGWWTATQLNLISKQFTSIKKEYLSKVFSIYHYRITKAWLFGKTQEIFYKLKIPRGDTRTHHVTLIWMDGMKRISPLKALLERLFVNFCLAYFQNTILFVGSWQRKCCKYCWWNTQIQRKRNIAERCKWVHNSQMVPMPVPIPRLP